MTAGMDKISDILAGSRIGRESEIRGWVYRIRGSASKVFVILRDSSGIVQCVGSRESLGEERFKELSSLTIESSLSLRGSVAKDDRAPTGFELKISDFTIYQRNDNFPISKDMSEEFLLDVRHLWVRSREFTAMLKIRSTVFNAFSEFFYNEGYYEVHTPMMVSTATEGGSTLFKLPFFGEEVSLSQSSQFYLETLIFSLEKVFTVAPSFRAEKSRTWRHLTEYWHGEAEVAWMNNEEMMAVEEKMIEHVVRRVLEERQEELSIIKREPAKLERIRTPFLRKKYSEIVKESEIYGLKLKYGDDFGMEEERSITKSLEKPIFVTHYPVALKSFYHRPDPENPSEILCHDLLAPEGYGEIIGGGERIWDLEELKARMQEGNFDPEQYYWYLDLRKYGSVPHSGFGLGMDRLVTWICGLQTIRDAIPYPRTIRRIKP
jgi:asparaginyl-tRNA synthetase